jgi:hypothetical protein
MVQDFHFYDRFGQADYFFGIIKVASSAWQILFMTEKFN